MKDLQIAVSEQLTAAGYLLIHTQDQRVSFFVRTVEGTTELLCLLDDRNNRLSGERVFSCEGIVESCREFLVEYERRRGNEYTRESNILIVALTDAPAQTRQYIENCAPYWLIDASVGRIMIYENQPGEFGCARERIERALVGKGTGEWKKYVTSVNTTLVVLNILIFLAMEILGNTMDVELMYQWGGLWAYEFLKEPQWYRLLTCAFLHFGVQHLFNNMLVLFTMGSQLERLMGHWRYLALYLISAVGASGISLWWRLNTGDMMSVSAGASGAIFGVLGGLLWVVLCHRGHVVGISRRQLMMMILFSLFHGIASAGVDNMAHIGGLLVGFVLSILLYQKNTGKKSL